MKLTKEILANAFAITATIGWIICTAGVALLPDLSLILSRAWMHGLDVSTMGRWRVTIEDFLLGGIFLVAFSWFIGYIFGWSLEFLSKRK